MTKRTRIVSEDADVKATVLDYANSNPLAVRLTDTDGNYAGSGGGGDGAITDGASAAIKATVLDYTNSNPLAVRLTDTSGDYVGAGAGTQYTEDAVAAADPTGTAPILVRKDAPAGLTSADGDNVAQRGTNYGAAYVQVVSSAGAFVDTFGGGTQYTEGDTDATITGTVMMMEGAANALVAAQGTAVDGLLVNLGANNDVSIAGTVNVNGSGFTQPVSGTVTANAGSGTMAVSAASLPLPTGAATAAKQPALGSAGTASTDVLTVQGIAAMTALKVDGSGVTQPVSGTVGISAGTANIGDVDVLTVPAPLSTTGGGTEATALRVTVASDSTGVLSVDDNGGSLTVDGTVGLAAGTNNIGDVDVLTVPADPFGVNADAASATGSISAKLRFIAVTGIPVTGTVTVGSHAVTNAGTFAVQSAGDVAHDGIDSGSPVKIGAKAETSPKGITLVADGDRTDILADADGIQMVKIGTANGDLISERIADTSGTSTAFTNFSAVAATRNYVTSLHIYNSSASAGFVDIRDGAAGAVLFTAAAPAGGGMTIANAVPFIRSSANTALAYDVSGALTTMYINIAGFQSKS